MAAPDESDDRGLVKAIQVEIGRWAKGNCWDVKRYKHGVKTNAEPDPGLTHVVHISLVGPGTKPLTRGLDDSAEVVVEAGVSVSRLLGDPRPRSPWLQIGDCTPRWDVTPDVTKAGGKVRFRMSSRRPTDLPTILVNTLDGWVPRNLGKLATVDAWIDWATTQRRHVVKAEAAEILARRGDPARATEVLTSYLHDLPKTKAPHRDYWRDRGRSLGLDVA